MLDGEPFVRTALALSLTGSQPADPGGLRSLRARYAPVKLLPSFARRSISGAGVQNASPESFLMTLT